MARYEVFHHPIQYNLNEGLVDDGDYPGDFPDGDPYEEGWYFWVLGNTPGTLDHSDPSGPFDTEDLAKDAATFDAIESAGWGGQDD